MSTNQITRHLRERRSLLSCIRREHVPRAVVVAEEEKCYRSVWSQRLYAHVTPPVGACETESGYPNWCLRSWPQPIFHQHAQRPSCGALHPRLLQPCRRRFGCPRRTWHGATSATRSLVISHRSYLAQPNEAAEATRAKLPVNLQLQTRTRMDGIEYPLTAFEAPWSQLGPRSSRSKKRA